MIGIKVWVFKGEIIEHDPMASEKKAMDQNEGGGRPPRRDNDDRGDRRERRGGRGGRPGGPGGGSGGDRGETPTET